jgi:hypothetical protein
MFEKQKASKEVDRIFEMAEATATLPMPFPTYNSNVRFELLFLFFFLLDYRKFINLDQSLRSKILDVFIERVAAGLTGGGTKAADALYDQRIGVYYAIMQRTKTVGDFLEPASDYIELLALYASDTGHFPAPNLSVAEMEAEITSSLQGKLKEPIAMSIAMHAQGLL